MKNNLQSGQASRLLLVLAIVVLVAVAITYLVMRWAQKPAPPTPVQQAVQPVYERTLGDIRFVFESALDKGETLRIADIINSQYKNSSNKKTFEVSNPGAKFIAVTVGAQNVGLANTKQGDWSLGNIVDSKGRNFVALDSSVQPWLPYPNLCGTLLKPAFDPTPCTKIYEVSKESSGFKIIIKAESAGKASQSALDLIVK